MSNGKNKKITRILALIVAVAMLVMTFFYMFSMTGWFGSALEKGGFVASAASDASDIKYRAEDLQQMILEIQELYKDEVSLDTLFDGAYKGLFESLGDPWSVYYPSSQTATQIVNNIQGEYGGIGITMQMAQDKVIVTATVVDSPAYKAGIMAGDYILKVNSTDVAGMAIEDVSLLVRGEAGTSVALTVERGGVQNVFTMTRQIIKTTSVTSTMMDGNIAYIKISGFDSNTDEEFKAAHLGLLNQGMTGMIIDLRDNGGGLMNPAINIADQLIPTSGTIAYYEKQGEIIETVSSTADSTRAVPTVVLINENTASASECLVGALKDRGVATLIGETTFGKGVAQIISGASEGAAMKLSVFYFLTPNKTRINGSGVTPDIIVNSSGHLTQEEMVAIDNVIAPMTESVKYFAGGVGLNVYAAQQRLQYLDYDLELTAAMDEKTIAAIKKFQAAQKLSPYGGLDFTTTKALATAFDSYINPKVEDLQLAKAVETLAR